MLRWRTKRRQRPTSRKRAHAARKRARRGGVVRVHSWKGERHRPRVFENVVQLGEERRHFLAACSAARAAASASDIFGASAAFLIIWAYKEAISTVRLARDYQGAKLSNPHRPLMGTAGLPRLTSDASRSIYGAIRIANYLCVVGSSVPADGFIIAFHLLSYVCAASLTA